MKKFFVTVRTWLRSIVTTISKGERVKGENNKHVEMPANEARSSSTSHIDPIVIRMEEYIGEHYEVRLNLLSQHYELSPLGMNDWAKLDEEAIYRLMMEMNRAGICITKPYLVRAVVQGSELVKRYHPVYDYLESLPEWDGTPHIEALFRRVTDDKQLLGWLRKWFVAMVAQVMGRMGTYGNSVCPILISRQQGWGKSQFAKMLMPPQLRMFFSDTFNLAQEDACLRRMTAYMLINVDEVDRFAGRRMPIFKNLVQLSAVSMKRSYHSQMEERERMASGERCWFDEEETRQLEAHNASFSTSQGVWALMKHCLTLCEIPEGNEERLARLYSSSEVYDYLCHQSPSAMGGIERSSFGYFLTEFGAQQVRVRNKRVYGVCLANANDNINDN